MLVRSPQPLNDVFNRLHKHVLKAPLQNGLPQVFLVRHTSKPFHIEGVDLQGGRKHCHPVLTILLLQLVKELVPAVEPNSHDVERVDALLQQNEVFLVATDGVRVVKRVAVNYLLLGRIHFQ